MKHDPFGSLSNWGKVLDLLEELANNNQLASCQTGLIRILRYKGHWRLREEVLKRIGRIQAPSNELIDQLLSILADDNIYYDVRILAGNAMIQLLKSVRNSFCGEINKEIRKVVEKLKRTPQPPFLEETLDRLHIEVNLPNRLEV
ncbi:MAG TPA: hypothetical protein PKV75_11780 [Desulfobacterales bacterium]|nr:hypothetical protein [Desulfobacterales bacterium]